MYLKTLKIRIMKTLFALIITAFIGNVALATGGGLKVSLESNELGTTVMEISSSEISTFEIDITNAYGEKLYRMKTKTPRNEFSKYYDFSKLEDGMYWYTVRIDKEKITKKLSLKDGNVAIEEVRRTVDPYFLQEKDLLKITYMNYAKDDVTLILYDSNRQVLARAVLGDSFSLQEAIDISELRYGGYEVVLINEEDIFDYNFFIE